MTADVEASPTPPGNAAAADVDVGVCAGTRSPRVILPTTSAAAAAIAASRAACSDLLGRPRFAYL